MIACDQTCSDAPNSHAAANAGSRSARNSRAHPYTAPQAHAPSTALDKWPSSAGLPKGSCMNRWQSSV